MSYIYGASYIYDISSIRVNTSEFSVSSINMAENKLDRNVSVFAVQFVGFVRS